MGLFCIEYQCIDCGLRFDYLAEPDERDMVVRDCACGGVGEKVVSAPYSALINPKNSDFAARQKERLDKRSNDHWWKKGRDEGMDRQKAAMKKAQA